MTSFLMEKVPCLILRECSCLKWAMGDSWISLPTVATPADPHPQGLVLAAQLWCMIPP